MNIQIDVNYFKSIFESFGFSISKVEVKKFENSNKFFVADNGFFSIYCIFYNSAISAVTFLSSDKKEVERIISEIKDFPDIYNERYFKNENIKEIDPLLYNHDYSATELQNALYSVTDYIKKYYSFNLKSNIT